MASKTLVSLQEYLELPEDSRYELVQGELTFMAPAAPPHGLIIMRIGSLLTNAARHLQIATGTGCKLGDNPPTVRIPDVSFYTKERWARQDGGLILGAPDLAIEVISPSESAMDVMQKVEDYLAYGSQAVWLVYSQTASVQIYEPGLRSRTVRGAGLLECQGLFPNFAVPASTVFD